MEELPLFFCNDLYLNRQISIEEVGYRLSVTHGIVESDGFYSGHYDLKQCQPSHQWWLVLLSTASLTEILCFRQDFSKLKGKF